MDRGAKLNVAGMTRTSIVALLVVLALGCSGGNQEAQTQKEMKEGFTSRPSRDQLQPEQQKRYDAMKNMAEEMAKKGNGGK